ncbi:MAG: hypothetical protein R3Y26_11560 [Rikenellaceae bacterium]
MKEFITNNWETIVAFVSVAWGVYQWAKNRGRSEVKREQAVKELGNKHNDLVCVKNANYTDRVNRSVEISMSNNEMLHIVTAWVMKQDSSTIEQMAKKFSPRKLTELGERVYKESAGKQVVEDNIEFFVEELRKIKPNTAYDVEQKALEVLLKNLGIDAFIPIKTYLYNAPEFISYINPDTN